MSDEIEWVGNSMLQHGKENNRVYLMKLGKEDYPNIVQYINNLAINDNYTKVTAKIPSNFKDAFMNDGYQQEAYIKEYFADNDDCLFLCKYFSKEREEFSDKNDILLLTQFCMEKATLSKKASLDNTFKIQLLDKTNISEIIDIYKKVFASYPFPIFDGNYILKTMNKNIDYFGVFEGKKLISIASTEMDFENSAVEMTDFATLPEYRGNSLSYHLLNEMEKSVIEKDIRIAYTISRAKNTGINMTFAKMQYELGGTLINNTNICSDIETMNVWYKKLINN